MPAGSLTIVSVFFSYEPLPLVSLSVIDLLGTVIITQLKTKSKNGFLQVFLRLF